jgi:hypothetical protein
MWAARQSEFFPLVALSRNGLGDGLNRGAVAAKGWT